MQSRTKPVDGSDKATRILAFVNYFWDRNAYAPSVRDIQYGCAFSSTSVVERHLGKLVKRGKIGRVPGLARTITVLERTA